MRAAGDMRVTNKLCFIWVTLPVVCHLLSTTTEGSGPMERPQPPTDGRISNDAPNLPWVKKPKLLLAALAECHLVPDDIVALTLGESDTLILRKSWAGNLDDLQKRWVPVALPLRMETTRSTGSGRTA